MKFNKIAYIQELPIHISELMCPKCNEKLIYFERGGVDKPVVNQMTSETYMNVKADKIRCRNCDWEHIL